MQRCGLRFSLSVIVSELWRQQWRHNERCGLYPGREPRSVAASFVYRHRTFIVAYCCCSCVPQNCQLRMFTINTTNSTYLLTPWLKLVAVGSRCDWHVVVVRFCLIGGDYSSVYKVDLNRMFSVLPSWSRLQTRSTVLLSGWGTNLMSRYCKLWCSTLFMVTVIRLCESVTAHINISRTHVRYCLYRLGHGGECIVWSKWTRVCLSMLRDRRWPSTGS